jgi:hypothetical protein
VSAFQNPFFYSTVLLALVLVGLLYWHFKKPFPLITIPELPHHLYFVEDEKVRDALLDILLGAGHPVHGEFNFGVRQVLLKNGTTVVALRKTDEAPACLSIPVIKPIETDDILTIAKTAFEGLGKTVQVVAVAGTHGLIHRVIVEDLGFELVLHPPGREMMKIVGGMPKFKPYSS